LPVAVSSADSRNATGSATIAATALPHPKPRGMAPKGKDGTSPCKWDGQRGCWVDVDGSDHVPLSEAEGRKQRRKRTQAAGPPDAEASARVPRPRGPAPVSHPHWDDVAGVWRDDDGDARPHASRNERRVEQKSSQDDEYTTWPNRQRIFRKDPWMHTPPAQMPCPQGMLTREGSVLRFTVGDEVWCCCGHYMHARPLYEANSAFERDGRLDRFGQPLPGTYNANLSLAFPVGTGSWPPPRSVNPDERSAWVRGRIIKQWHQQESFGQGRYAAYAIVLAHPSSPQGTVCDGWSKVRPQVFAPVDDDRCVRAYSERIPSPQPVEDLISCSPRGWTGWDAAVRADHATIRYSRPPGVDAMTWMGLLLSPDEQPPAVRSAGATQMDTVAPGEYTGCSIPNYCCSGSIKNEDYLFFQPGLSDATICDANTCMR
jgi:hypothetical protein